jgi:hypothetical protein
MQPTSLDEPHMLPRALWSDRRAVPRRIHRHDPTHFHAQQGKLTFMPSDGKPSPMEALQGFFSLDGLSQ